MSMVSALTHRGDGTRRARLWATGKREVRRLRTFVLEGAQFAARIVGFDAWLRGRCRDRLLVLCYHGIIPDDCPPHVQRLIAHPRQRAFRQHLRILTHRFHVVSEADVRHHILHGTRLPSYPALITFDDGLRNNLTCAAPELRRLGLPATVFVPTAHLGKDDLLWTHEVVERIVSWRPDWLPMPAGKAAVPLRKSGVDRWDLAVEIREECKALPDPLRQAYLTELRQEPLLLDPVWRREVYAFLSWDELRGMHRDGWSVGSHTVTHPMLPQLAPEPLEFELRESKARVEKELGCPCPSFAHPNGGTSAAVTDAVKAAGYELAYLLNDRVNSWPAQRHTIDRVGINAYGESTFMSKLGGLRTLRRSR